jgi:hypothetical protein
VKKFYLIIAFLLISISAHAGWITLRDTSLNEIGTADNPLKVRLAEGESLGSSKWDDGDSDAIYYNDGNVGIGTSAPSGVFSVGSAAGGNVYFFENNEDVGDTTDGQILYITRKAAEGDSTISLYTNQVKNSYISTTGNGLFLTATSKVQVMKLLEAEAGIDVTGSITATKTTEQLRLGYDSSNYVSTTVGSTGVVTMDAVGSGSSFVFSDPVSVTGITTLTGTGGGKLLLQDTDTSGYTLCTALNGTLTCCTDDNADGTCD